MLHAVFVPTILQLSPVWLTTLIVFVLIIVSYIVGNKIRLNRNKRLPALAEIDTGKMSGILIGLLGFLLAFTFGMANSRYDKRRELIIQEANDIGTAFLRTKVLPDSMQKIITPLFNAYLDARIDFSTGEFDLVRLERDFIKADSIGKEIWRTSVNFTDEKDAMLRMNTMIPALNAMIDITTTRRSAGESTIPDSILYFLFMLAFCSAFLLGYESKGKVDGFILGVFTIMISFTIFTILDLDRPRGGFITTSVANQKLIELQGTFK